ncbi:MAG: hypothetical protein RI895_658 [Actinomycetota bacterium]|jgi:tetratricopeptide (TPR) repeat protein
MSEVTSKLVNMEKAPDDMSKEELWEALDGATGFRRGDILLNLSQHLLHDDSFEPALTCAQEAVESFEQAGFPRERAYALRQIAHVHQHEGRTIESIEKFKELLPLFDLHGTDLDTAMANESIADGLRGIYKFEQALDHYRLAEDFYMRCHNSPESVVATGRNYAACLANIGGRDDEVLEKLTSTLEFAKGRIPITKVNELRSEFVYALAQLDRFDEAIVEAKIVLSVAKACSCSSCVPDALIDLGYIYDLAGEPESARNNYQQAFDMAHEKSLVIPQAHSLTFFAEQAIKSDTTSARDFAQRAEAIYNTTGDQHCLANVKGVQAQISKAEGKHDEAISFLSEEIEIRSRTNDMQHIADAQRELAKVYLLKGSPRNALQELSANGWVERKGSIKSKSIGEHKALYAKALLADGQTDAALNRATELLTELDPALWLDVHGIAHEVLAYALRHSDPMASESAAARALACFIVSGNHSSAKSLSQEFFIQPYLSLDKFK